MKNNRQYKDDSLTDSTTQINNKINENNSSIKFYSNNNKIPISINKKIKSIFKYALNEIGIDIMNPKNFIDKLLNIYISQETQSKEKNEYRDRVENFVKTFIFLLVNWKFSLLEKTFDVKENILKLLLKKQLFKCNYLSNHPIDVYKKKEKLQIKNLFVIFNVIKSIEYKYSIRIIGIESYEKKKENGYSLERKFHWFIKFVDYIIILYLSEDLIISFSQFIKRKSMKDLIETFDKEKDFSLSYFYYQENEEKFVRKIIYIVENVIYNIILINRLINKK